MSNHSEQVKIDFDCWSCSRAYSQDLDNLQKDRVEIDYQEIVPNPDDPSRYHVRCPHCGKFNTVYL